MSGIMEGVSGLYPKKRAPDMPGIVGLSELARASLIQEAGGRYTELAWNGVLYTVSSGLIATPAAGPLAAGGTPMLALWNPINSGFIAAIMRIGVFTTAYGTVSGKGYEIDTGPTSVITQATTVKGVANKIGAAADGDIVGFSNVALTGSSALARLRALTGLGAGTAQNNQTSQPVDEVGGALILMPGTLMALTALLLGTANEATAFIEYAKIAAN